MRWLAILALLAACSTTRDDGDEQIETALREAGASEATLIDGDKVYYLGAEALRAEQRELRTVLAGAPSRHQEFVRGSRTIKERGADGVIGLRYPQQSLAFTTDKGHVRIRRAQTTKGRYYWVSLEQGRWTFSVGPLGGDEIDRAWDRVARGAARAAGRLHEPAFYPWDPTDAHYGSFLRQVGVDYSGLNEDG